MRRILAASANLVPPAGGAPIPGIGMGTTFAPKYYTGVGGGPFPSLVGAPTLSVAGDGTTDVTAAFQSAINSATAAGKPLLIPTPAVAYRITSDLVVTTSLIGLGTTAATLPTIRQTNTADELHCMRLEGNMHGWIYGLHLVGTYTGSQFNTGATNQQSHGIAPGTCNGVTIRACKIELFQGSGIQDHPYRPAPNQPKNILIDNCTVFDCWQTDVSFVSVLSNWAIMNNFLDYRSCLVQAVDWEPWREQSYIENVELGYNRIDSPNPHKDTVRGVTGYCYSVVQYTNGFDTTPGSGIRIHHNYGDWGVPFLLTTPWPDVIVEPNNIEGLNVPA